MALSPIVFGEWTPDAAKTSGGLVIAKGVLSRGGRYTAKPAISTYAGTAQISGTVIGAFSCFTGLGGGAQQHLFLGTSSRLYRLANSTPVDVSTNQQAYAGVDGDWVWSFEQFGENILAGARGVPLQRFRFGEDRWFREVPDAGATEIDAEIAAPRTVDALGRIGPHILAAAGRRLQWCAFNNVDYWTPDAAYQSGETSMNASGGGIVAIRGGESGAIFQERAITRIAYVGGATAFQLDEVETNRGAMSPKSIIGLGRQTFYVSEEGFFLFDGLQSLPIGLGKVDKWFQSRVNYAYRHRITASFDVQNRCVIVSYPADGSSTPNEQLIWSMGDNRWTYDDESIAFAWEMGREGATMDGATLGAVNLDTLTTTSLDSPIYRESRRQWAAVSSSGYVSLFEGSNRAARLTTSEVALMPGRRGVVTEIWPIGDTPAASTSVTVKSRAQTGADSQVSATASTQNSVGFCPVRVDARYIQAQVDIAAAASWTELTGIATDMRPSSIR